MDSIFAPIDVTNICRQKIRTKTPCGRECPPGKKVCNPCKEEFNRRIELRKRKPKNDISLEEVNVKVEEMKDLLNSFSSDKVKL